MEDLLSSIIIDTHKVIDVEVFDVNGAYPNSDMPEDKFIILKIEGEFVEIVCEVNPEHKKYMRIEKFMKVIYQSLLNVLCGCMESMLL